MAKTTIIKHATIELSKEDWDKIAEVYYMIDHIKNELSENGFDLDDSVVEFKDSDDDVLDIGEYLQSIYDTINILYEERTGLY